jgi:hypothetical protein
MVGSTPWSYWVAARAGFEPIFSGVAGSGSAAQCIEPGNWGGFGSPDGEATAVAQMPGKPVAFFFGYVQKSPVRADGLGPFTVTRISAILNGINVQMVPAPYKSSPDRLLFAEVTGFRCAPSITASAGIYYSYSVFAGHQNLYLGGNGSVNATGNGVNSRNTDVSCAAVILPLADLTSDLARAPAQLRLDALHTIESRSVEIREIVEHPLSARKWGTYASTYDSPDRFSSSGPNGPEVPATEKGCYGFTAAQVLAFSDLLITVHTGAHFQPIAGGYRYTSESAFGTLASEEGWGGSCAQFDYANTASVQGTITVAHGYVTSVSTTLLYAGCTPPGPSCHATTTTAYSDFNAAPRV